MRRYFFHINDGADFLDQVGTEVASDELLRPMAVKTAAGIIGEDETLWNGNVLKVRVVSETGKVILTVELTAVVTASAGRAS
ncbi:hypothetical protein RWK44_28485 [Rhizobium sp. 25PS6]|uniref:DUF6894 domain-containing protein n=1 Tax=Rhizobium aouanii TaxID=3118145 RepID=A0ABU8CW44_9HYPH|nr:hypothetical protein [Rhizobium sp. 25PS6]MDU0364331.1 hypothetical protein [Rhizobium sp. 25PS6]